jgi:hypothetical protein
MSNDSYIKWEMHVAIASIERAPCASLNAVHQPQCLAERVQTRLQGGGTNIHLILVADTMRTFYGLIPLAPI